MSKYTIYAIENLVNGKWYVGQTANFRNRKKQHMNELKRGVHHSTLLQHDYNQFKLEIKWHILDHALTQDDSFELEERWIMHFNSYYDGYNNRPSQDENPTSCVPCEWNGVQYESISLAASELNVSVDAMWRRVNKGLICDDDLDWQLQPTIWNGVEYRSISEAARENNIPFTSFKRYIEKGYIKDSDIPAGNFNKSKPIMWNNVEYTSIREMCRVFDLDHNTVRYWLSKSYTSFSDLPPNSKYYRKD